MQRREFIFALGGAAAAITGALAAAADDYPNRPITLVVNFPPGGSIKQKTGIEMVHVPYRGGAPLMQDLIAGNVKVSFNTLPTALPQAQAGMIRIIAVAEKARLPELPDIPTIDETIGGVVNIGWNGLLAPAGTPAPIIDKLNAVAVAALKTLDIIAKMKLQGLHAMSSTPAEFASLIAREVDYWAAIIPAIGIQPE